MKLRKVLSLIIAIAMIMTASTAFAFSDVTVEDDAYEAITALSALNILTGYKDGTFLPEGKVTRAEFATIIMRAKGYNVATTTNTIFDDVKADHWASGAIAEAFGAAIVNGRVLEYDANGNVIGGTFDPEAEVTYEEATKMIVCALGYQQMAESMVKPGVNPYPTAYNLIANQRSITTDVPKTAGGASRATIARLVWNALPVDLFEQTVWGTDNNFSQRSNKSLLLNSLDAVLLEEAKLSSSNNLLDAKDVDIELNTATIQLDDVSLNAGWTNGNFASVKLGACDVKGLQGLTVKALVSIEDKYNPTLLAVFPTSANRTLEVNPALYVGITSGNKIEYYPTSTSSTTNTSSSVEIDSNGNVAVDVYVNGKSVNTTSGSLADIAAATSMGNNPNNKLYTFADTNNNGYYDTLFIDNTASFVVGRVSVEDNEIIRDSSTSVYNSSTLFVSMGDDYDYTLTLDPEEDTVTWDMVDETGKELTVADVNAGDVITYAMTTDGTLYYYDIVVCKSTAVTGTVTGTRTDKRTGKTLYNIDGTEYVLNNENAGSLEIGSTGTFQLTADNKIISCELDKSVRNFAAAIAVKKDTSGAFSNGALKMQVMDADGAVTELAFADKFYNNATLTANETTTEIAANETALASLSGNVVMYELNGSGAIKGVYYGTGIAAKDSDYKVKSTAAFTTSTDKEMYKATSEKVGSVYLTEASAVVATEQANANLDQKKDYSLITADSLVDEESYFYTAVVDADNNAVFAIIRGFDVVPAYSSVPMYVTGTGSASVDGDSRTSVTGLVNGEEVTYNMVETTEVDVVAMGANTDLANPTTEDLTIRAGDVIQYVLNGNGEIAAFRHMVKVNAAGTTAKFLVTTAANEDSKTSGAASVVEYKLKDTAAMQNTVNTAGVNGKATITAGSTAYGYAQFGRVYKASGRSVSIFTNIVDSGEDDALGNDILIPDEATLVDVVGSADMPLYIATNNIFDGYQVKALDGLRTFYSQGRDITKTDDVVYIYRYDGEVVLQYAIDSIGDNK